MVFVCDTDTFENEYDHYNEFEKKYLEKTKNYLKSLRKTLVQQIADEVSKTVIDDLKSDMYSNFLDFAHNLWKEALNYILGEKTYKDGETFKDFALSLGYDAEKLRKKIYEDNKEELKREITCDYLYGVLDYFYRDSSYWKDIDLKFDEPYTQYRIMERFMKHLAEDDKFDDILFELVSEKVKAGKEELNLIKKELERINYEISEISGFRENCKETKRYFENYNSVSSCEECYDE